MTQDLQDVRPIAESSVKEETRRHRLQSLPTLEAIQSKRQASSREWTSS